MSLEVNYTFNSNSEDRIDLTYDINVDWTYEPSVLGIWYTGI